MARTPNYNFEKRQREIQKKEKKAAKAEAKRLAAEARREEKGGEGADSPRTGTADKPRPGDTGDSGGGA